jgi:multidrug efflux pump subunit AcrA (membrane-fusion protein)
MLVGLFAVAAVGAAGYVGYRSAAAGNEPAPPSPETVPVTRGEVRQTVSAPGKVIELRHVTLAPAVGGQLAEVHVRAGDHVSAGDVLARLETSDLARSVKQAELTVRQAELDLERLTRPAGQNEFHSAERAVERAAAELEGAQLSLEAVSSSPLLNETLADARAAYEDARNRYDLTLTLYECGETDYWYVEHFRKIAGEREQELNRVQQQSAVALAAARAAVTRARLDFQQAQDDLQALQDGPDPLELAAGQLALELAELALAEAQANLKSATLVAPFDGAVVRVTAAAGDIVPAGAELIAITDPRAVEVEVTVIEEDLPWVEVGQEVELFFDARPEATVAGRVARIVPRRDPTADRPLYPVAIAPTGMPDDLLPGMTADASIIVARRSGVLCLPRALVRARPDSTGRVEVWTGGRIEERVVRVGLRGDVLVEILSGLEQGEQVVAR